MAFAQSDRQRLSDPLNHTRNFPSCFQSPAVLFFCLRRDSAEYGFDIPDHGHQTRADIVAQPVLGEAERGRATVKRIRAGSVIKL